MKQYTTSGHPKGLSHSPFGGPSVTPDVDLPGGFVTAYELCANRIDFSG